MPREESSSSDPPVRIKTTSSRRKEKSSSSSEDEVKPVIRRGRKYSSEESSEEILSNRRKKEESSEDEKETINIKRKEESSSEQIPSNRRKKKDSTESSSLSSDESSSPVRMKPEEKRFAKGIKVGGYNRSIPQERKMADLGVHLPSVLSELSIDIESGFSGQLTTTIKGRFTAVALLSNNRIVTGVYGTKLKVWDMLTDKILLSIESPRDSTGRPGQFKTIITKENYIITQYKYNFRSPLSKMNSIIVFDADNGKILARLEDSLDEVSNIFAMSNGNIFFTLTHKEKKESIVTSYVWNITNNKRKQVGLPFSSPSDSLTRFISLDKENFALLHQGKLYFYKMTNLKSFSMKVDLRANDYLIDGDEPIIYLSNGQIVFTGTWYMFWVNPQNGKINGTFKLPKPVDIYPLLGDNAIASFSRNKIFRVEIWDLKVGNTLSTLPPLSSNPLKESTYFAVGLLPNGNLVSVYEDRYLIITNLATNTHEKVIDLKEKIKKNDILILEDGGICIKFLKSLKVWR
jgi:hypothetical protein